MWVKLKLASQSEESLSDWNEEDLRRTEEIKAELLLRAKESALAKVQTTAPENSFAGGINATVCLYIPIFSIFWCPVSLCADF